MADNKDKYQDLFERLEKATSALEQIVAKNSDISIGKAKSEDSTSNKSSSVHQQPKVEEEEEDDPSVKGFYELFELYLDPFISYSRELNNEELTKAADLFNNACQYQSKFVKCASLSKKPDYTSPSSAELVKPLQTALGDLNTLKEKSFKSDYYPQLCALAEASNVLNWFLIEPAPASYIGDIKDSTVFWTNKVLKTFKEKDPRCVEWVRLLLNIFDGLKIYVKQYHTTGLVYKASGDDFASNLKRILEPGSTTSQESSVPASTAGSPPPPPPPPPADLFTIDVSAPAPPPSSTGGTGGINAVFSELNQGEDITKGLKKVEKSQMTHKNPELRQSSVVRSASSGSASSVGKKLPPVPKKPNAFSLKPKPKPVIELKDSKWIVKNVKDNHEIKLDVEISQSLFIADSENITVQLNGKLNAIQISGTKKLGLVIDSLISEVSIINSKKYGIQVVGFVPQFSIDKSDGGEIYLNENSLTTEFYTTCTTGLNIYAPDAENEGEFKEVNVPEQFKFRLNEKRSLVSDVVEHAG